MGVIILATAVAVEAMLALYSLRTRSQQDRVRAVVRIVWFAGLVVVVVLPVTDWGLRYYALLALGFVLAVRSVVVLVRGQPSPGAAAPVRVRRIVLQAGGMMLLMFAVTLPAVVFPEAEPLETTGEYRVSQVTHTYVDADRVEPFGDRSEPRRLTVEIWYPDADDDRAPRAHPLIVYSHGAAGIRSGNESLCAELASHGYVVVAIDHTYHSLFTTDTEGRTTWIARSYWRELNDEDARSDRQQSHRLYQAWLKVRLADLGFVLDHVLAEATKAGAEAPYRHVDVDAIGVMGHSLGGSAALGLARERDDIDAVAALESPFLWDIEGVEDGEFVWNDDPYPIPALNLYSDSSWSHLADWPQYAANHAALSDQGGNVASVHLAGVGHFGLSDLALTSPILTRLLDGHKPATTAEYALRSLNAITLDFFDAHLTADPRPANDPGPPTLDPADEIVDQGRWNHRSAGSGRT